MTDGEISRSAAVAAGLMSMAEFLEAVPPSRITRVSDVRRYESRTSGHYLDTPDIQLHCDNDACNGLRFFGSIDRPFSLGVKQKYYYFFTYRCRNCRVTILKFAIAIDVEDNSNDGKLLKLGELPPYGSPTPARLIKLIGPDRGLFLTGRRAENQGMGIGAFAYYRRVVENQKDRILEEITKVTEKL